MHEDYRADFGERVLRDALAIAQARWGMRLVAAYALGSLAHGGFSAHVSDVDLGLLFADPLQGADAEGVEQLSRTITGSGAPLSDRLSVFWGSVATCSGAAAGGRFPPVDRLDLAESGRLLVGTDVRARIPKPAVEEMVLAAARSSVGSLSKAEMVARLKNPALLVQEGVRPLTKRVLFPVRYFFTARTGRIGATDLAVQHFVSAERGPAAELAAAALEWRYAPPELDDPGVLACMEKGLLPLHRIYLQDYEARLLSYGAEQLARDFGELLRLYASD